SAGGSPRRPSSTVSTTVCSRSPRRSGEWRGSAAVSGSGIAPASSSSNAGRSFSLAPQDPGVGLGQIDRNVTAFLQRPRGQFRRRLTWSSPGPGVGIRFWVGGNLGLRGALAKIGGDPADVYPYGDL